MTVGWAAAMRSVKLGHLAGLCSLMWLPVSQAAAFSNIQEAYFSALKNDNVFIAAESQYRSVLEKLPQARAGLLPTVSASYNRTNNDAQVDYANSKYQDINRKFLVNGWTVTLTQPLFRLASWLNYGRAQLQVEQADVQLEIARRELTVRFVQVFMEWQKVSHARKVAESVLRHKEAYVKHVRSRLSLKLATVPESLDAEAQLKKARSDLIDAERGILVKVAELAKVVGAKPQAKSFAFSDASWPEVKGTVEQWVERAGDANGQVRYGTLQEAISAKDVDIARSGHLPNVNLVAGRSNTFNSGSTSPVDGSSANTQLISNMGIQVEIPIFAGGMVVSKTSEAVALHDKALADLNNARSTAVVDAQIYYYQSEVGISAIEAAQEKLRAIQSALDAAKAAHVLNLRTELDVLSAQADLAMARRDLFVAQAERMLAILQLRRVVGELQDEDLVVWSSLLSPAPETAK